MTKRASHLPDRLRLPLRFDAERMLEEVRQIEARHWTPHFNRDEYAGSWDGVALLAPDSDPTRLYTSVENEARCKPTPVLDHCAYLSQVLAAFSCPLVSARLLRLGPGARIHEHRDYDLGPDCGRFRIHIPIQTGNEVRFIVGGRRVRMTEGETWYVDFGQLHRVENRGSVDRIHLVIDCLRNTWLEDLMLEAPRSGLPEETGTSEQEDPDPMELFRRRLVRDPTLADPLHACVDADEFARRAEDAASRAGFSIPRAEVELVMRSTARGGSLLELETAPPLANWIPEAVSFEGGRARVHWCFLGRAGLREPFFRDTLSIARRNPLNRFLRPVSSLESLEAAVASQPGLPLIGMIAHVSRCGSTLISQILAALPSLVVASEPPPLDDLLRGAASLPHERRIALIRAMVSALGQPRKGAETGCVIKLDSWHTAALDALREAFPQTPVALAYRHPAPVLASQMREPGLQMAGGLGEPFSSVSMENRTQLEYRGRIVGLLFEAAWKEAGRAILVNHDELPAAVGSRIAPAFGLVLSAEEEERLRQRGGFDSKSPQRSFDPHGHRPIPDDEVRRCAEEWAGAAYAALEKLRTGRDAAAIAVQERPEYATRLVSSPEAGPEVQ